MASSDLSKLVAEAEKAKAAVEALEAQLADARVEQRRAATALSGAITHLTGTPAAAAPARATSAVKKSGLPLQAIREWANANGHTVSDRGRIAEPVITAWTAAGKPGA